MSSARMEIDVLGDVPVARMLGRVKNNLEDWSAVWPEVGEHLARSAGRQFDSEGTYGSGGWAPLASSTLMRKRLLGQDLRILHATGRLEQSLRVAGHPEHVHDADEESLAWGTSVPYAKFHQQGTARMPRRRPVEPPEGSRRYVVRILQTFALSNDGPGPAGPSMGAMLL